MKPTYEEVIVKMSDGIGACPIPLDANPTSIPALQAKAAFRALQDMMPDIKKEDGGVWKMLDKKHHMYNHFKTMGRNNETK